MTSQLTRALAVLAAVAALAWVGPQSARAQFSYPGGYDPQSGFTWDEAFRYNPVTNPFGSREPEPSRPYYLYGRAAYYRNYPYAATSADYYSGIPAYGFMPPADYSYGAYSQSAPDNTAHLRLVVPPDARVWFGNSATQQAGTTRQFQSPQLTPGKDYTYDVKAQWTENGKEVTQTRRVDVSANSNVTVDFTRPVAAAQTTNAPTR